MGVKVYMSDSYERKDKLSITAVINDPYTVEEYDYEERRAHNAFNKISGKKYYNRQMSNDPADKRTSLALYCN